MRSRTLVQHLQSWLPLVPPLLLLAGTYWLNQQVQPIAPKSDSNQRHDIDYAVDKLYSVTLDERGQPRHLLTTEKMWHYPDDDATHLQSPRLVSMSPERTPMVISADSGKISSRGDEVFLSDNVKIVRLGNPEQDAMEFTTDYLHVIPETEQADTDRPVMMVTKNDIVHGIGMKLDNKSRTISLLSNVRATHEPVTK